MPQVGVPYQITGPDGTRAVFQDITDPDFVGYLTGDSAVTLNKEVRESAQDLVQADGGQHGDFYLGRLVMTMSGMLYPNTTIDVVSAYERKVRRAVAALRGDSIVRWTPVGDVGRRLLVRRQQDPQFTGLRPKVFLLTLVSANPFVEADSESNLTLTTAGGGEAGVSSPISNPITSAFTTTGQTFAINNGDVAAWPRFEFVGPLANPTIFNNTTGATIGFNITLAAGETLSIDSSPIRGRRVLYNGNDAYGAYDYVDSVWWQVVQGSNDIRLSLFSSGAGSAATMYWRDQWEV